MEISGKIIFAGEPRGGVSKRTGNSWKMQSFVVETIEQYPRKCCFDVFGEDKLKEFNIQVGEVMKVYFDVDASEYDGRWFNNIRAWKVERIAGSATAPASSPATKQPTSDEPPF